MAILLEILSSEDPHEGLRTNGYVYKPVLILLDNDMPGLKGLDLLKQLKEMPSTQHIPVIMLTGNNGENTVKTALKYQVAGYLLKPCDPENLFQSVFKTLENSRQKMVEIELQNPFNSKGCKPVC